MNPTALYPDLNGKTILVTGATRGIGRTIATTLAKQKAHVVFNFRNNNQEVESLIHDIKELGGTPHPLQFDVTKTEEMKAALNDFLKAHHQPISGLVNNAGISKDGLILRLKEEELDQILNTNLKSAMTLTAHLSRQFLKASDVSVINMSSVVGLMGNSSQTAYAASKAGLIGFTKSYAKELAPKNIRCNAICPGFIETEMTHALDEKVKAHYHSQIPLERFGKTQEVADLVCFLLSKASSYVTGEVIKIDGGLYC